MLVFPMFVQAPKHKSACEGEGTFSYIFNPLNAELNLICHLLALLEAHHILHISRIRVNHCSRRKMAAKFTLRIRAILNFEQEIGRTP